MQMSDTGALTNTGARHISVNTSKKKFYAFVLYMRSVRYFLNNSFYRMIYTKRTQLHGS